MKTTALRTSIGIDIGATNVRAGIIQSDGTILKVVKEKVTAIKKAEALIEQLSRMINSLEPKKFNVEVIGVGIPGPCKPGTGFVYVLPNLQIEAFDIGIALKKVTGIPTYVANDANVAALAEALVGEGKGYSTVQFLTISTGVGGGFVENGKILTGTIGYAQEVGNMIIGSSPIKPNPSMNAGCFESYCSGPSLIRQAAEIGVKIDRGSAIFELKETAAIADEWIKNLAIAIANMTLLYEPQIFILGGGVTYAKDYFLDKLRKRVNDFVFAGLKDKIVIKIAKNDQDAGLIGAGLMALQF